MSYEVSDAEIKSIFHSEIWPDLTIRNPTPQETPEAYVLGGQPGAGKSRFENNVAEIHGRNFVGLNGDEFRRFHPDFDAIEKEHGVESTKYTATFSGKITEMALKKAMVNKLNVVVEGTFRTTETPTKTLKDFREAGYHTNVMIATSQKDISWSSTLKRYSATHEAGGTPRYTPKDVHDLVVDRLSENVEKIVNSGLVDKTIVRNREGLIFDSENSQGSPKKQIESELRRRLTPEEHKDVESSYEKMLIAQDQLNAPGEERISIANQYKDYLSRSQNEQSNESRVLYALQSKMIAEGYSGTDLAQIMDKANKDLAQKRETQNRIDTPISKDRGQDVEL